MSYSNLIYIGIILPLLLMVCEWNKKSAVLILKFFLVYFGIRFIVSAFSGYQLLDEQSFNWLGKSFGLLVLLILIWTPRLNLNDFNFSLRYKLSECKKLFIFCGIYFLFRLLLYSLLPGANTEFHTETILYQISLPGMQEEILMRGVLLSLIHQMSRTHGIYWGNLPISWAALITSLLFGLEHSLQADSLHLFQFSYLLFIRSFVDGFIFARLTERTKSLVPAIIYHNLINLIGNH